MIRFLWAMRPYFRQVLGQLCLGSVAGIVMNTAVVLPAILLGRAIDTALALQLPVPKRLASPIFSWYGVVGCFDLTIAMPHAAVLAAAGTLAALTVSRWRPRRAIGRRRAA